MFYCIIPPFSAEIFFFLQIFSHIPEYKDVQSILNKYDVTEKQYLAFFQYAMIEPNLSGDCLLEVAEYAKSSQTKVSFHQILSKSEESI